MVNNNESFSFNILFTSDIHGHVYPYKYSDSSDANEGFAKVASVIQKYRTKNSLVIDAGDVIQGSVLTSYHNSFTANSLNPMVKVLNTISYDYNTLGNHDFNYGRDYLKKYTDAFNGRTLVNNIFEDGKTIYPAYHIHSFDNGPKVAIIGTTTQHIPIWEQEKNIKNLQFTNAFEETKKTLNWIRENEEVDFVVVLYHGGFEKDLETGQELIGETGENTGYLMLENLEIDILLTGHQHRLLSGTKFNTTYVQPGYKGSHLANIEINLAKKDGKWQKESIQPLLIEVGEIKADENILALNLELEKKAQKWLDIPLGHIKEGNLLFKDPLNDRLHKHKLFDFINQIQLEVSKASISCCSLGNDVKGFEENISLRDVVSTYIYPNTLYILSVSGQQLLEALEKNASFFEIKNNKVEISSIYLNPKVELYNYDVFLGIDYTIDLKESIGQRVKDVTYQKQEINPKQHYELVMNNYRACGGGGFDMFLNAEIVRTIEMNMADIIADYIKKHQEISIPEYDNLIIKY
ncbi:MAG: bifunctional metallophosphatase/5'-nucleotidase [Lactovum sp.]